MSSNDQVHLKGGDISMSDEQKRSDGLDKARMFCEQGDYDSSLAVVARIKNKLLSDSAKAKAALIEARCHYALAFMGPPTDKMENLQKASADLRRARLYVCDAGTNKDLWYLEGCMRKTLSPFWQI